jgi:uncharacterized protein (DUF1501 family)
MNEERRRFIRAGAHALVTMPIASAIAGAIGGCASAPAATTSAGYARLLILVELKGGNDGLNTLVPFTDPAYYRLRPKLGIARDAVVPLSDRCGLHPALQPLLALWKRQELAVLQGVGYPAPNLSHFRSIEIWDTASRSDQYLPTGWLTRRPRATMRPVDSSSARTTSARSTAVRGR